MKVLKRTVVMMAGWIVKTTSLLFTIVKKAQVIIGMVIALLETRFSLAMQKISGIMPL